MDKRIGLAVVTVLLSAALAEAQDSPRAILERAVEAHGGRERLGRYQADRARIKGSLVLNNKTVPFTGETVVYLPTRLKNVIRLDVEGKTHTLVQILNAEQAWVTIDGQPQKVEPTALAEMRETLALARAVRLMPLLNDRSYELTLLPEVKILDRATSGVKAVVKGRKEIRLYFDKETGFLVKTEHTLDDGQGKEVVQEELYSDFRDLNGFKRPRKIVVSRKGTKVMEAEMTEVKYFEKLDETEFNKP